MIKWNHNTTQNTICSFLALIGCTSLILSITIPITIMIYNAIRNLILDGEIALAVSSILFLFGIVSVGFGLICFDLKKHEKDLKEREEREKS